MATNSSQINVTELDFDAISDNLKNYLKGQSKFKDYDFEGSSMSVLIDLLAYASHIGAVNTNIAASELFLDSAQMRKNVVSRAKDLGFTPASEVCSSAIVDVTLNNVRNADGTYPTPTQMTMPRGTIFSTTFDGTNYYFVVPSSVLPTQNGSTYAYASVPLVQGTYATDTFVFDTQQANPKFVLSNAKLLLLQMYLQPLSLELVIHMHLQQMVQPQLHQQSTILKRTKKGLLNSISETEY